MVELDSNVIVQIFLVGISAVTAFIIWWRIGETNKITRNSNDELRKSNELMTLELRQKYAPNIMAINSKVQYESDKITATFSCNISNKGKIPLHDFKIYSGTFSKKPSLDELFQHEKRIKLSMPDNTPSIFPPDSHVSNFSFQFKQENQLKFWIVLWFDFEYLETIHEEMIILLNFEDLQSKGNEIISNKTIESARKTSSAPTSST